MGAKSCFYMLSCVEILIKQMQNRIVKLYRMFTHEINDVLVFKRPTNKQLAKLKQICFLLMIVLFNKKNLLFKLRLNMFTHVLKKTLLQNNLQKIYCNNKRFHVTNLFTLNELLAYNVISIIVCFKNMMVFRFGLE